MQPPNRILIIKPSSLGDVATTLPLLCDLHAAFPRARIDWLLHPAFTPLVEGHDALHEIIPFERKKLAAWWYKPSALMLFLKLLRQLRRNRYDLVIDAQGLFRSGFLARAAAAPRRIGFATAREGATLMYTDKVRLPDRGKKMLAVDRMRALAGPLGISTEEPAEFRLPLPPAAIAEAERRLHAAGIREPFVAVIPGARWNTKRWDIQRYAEVTGKILASGRPVVLLGSPDEKPLCDQLEKLLTASTASSLLNLAGQTSLRDMIALLSLSSLVIGNDSGPLHVAVALGRPILAIYGPTSPAFVGPYGQLDNVLRHDVSCHPCRRRDCSHHSCMRGVTVELVWERTQKILPRPQNSGAPK